jgi:hypothetical protein
MILYYCHPILAFYARNKLHENHLNDWQERYIFFHPG